jgi:hypothetical protein
MLGAIGGGGAAGYSTPPSGQEAYDAVTDTFTPPEITEIVTEAESGTPDGNA